MRNHSGHLTTEDHKKALEKIVGSIHVVSDRELLHTYAHDETEDIFYLPDLVVKAGTTDEVSQVLKYCNLHRIPVTPRGGGTGLTGGALANLGGVVLSTERLNSIISIDEKNLQVITQPGVITEVLQDAVKEKGLFFPPDPQSKGSCFIGGNIAENSGGPKAVKYGTVKDYVLNLEIVLPTGEIIWTGADVLKNATGYNLTQLIVGSEGTLGVVTTIVLKLIPLPRHSLLVMTPFDSAEKACESITAIFMAGYTPSAVEFVDRDTIELALKFTETDGLNIDRNAQAHLLIEVDGNNMDALMKDLEGIVAVVSAYNCGEILFAGDATQKDKLWRIRRSVGEAIKTESIYRDEDTVVPRAALPELLCKIKEIGLKYGFKTVCCGHAGDGNMHIAVLRGSLTEEQWNGPVKEGIREIFRAVKKLGGTISAEHGIGLVQKEYLNEVFNADQIRLMKGIKQVFDPNNILNRGKIFD